MKNYLLMMLAIASVIVLVLLQSKPLVHNKISLTGQTIDDLGIQFASLIEDKIMGADQAVAFEKRDNKSTNKSER